MEHNKDKIYLLVEETGSYSDYGMTILAAYWDEVDAKTELEKLEAKRDKMLDFNKKLYNHMEFWAEKNETKENKYDIIFHQSYAKEQKNFITNSNTISNEDKEYYEKYGQYVTDTSYSIEEIEIK